MTGSENAAATSSLAQTAKGPRTAATRRKKRLLAFVGDKCTGCSGAPVCIAVCPVEGALEIVREAGASPIVRVRVNPDECIGCALCVAQGYEGALTEGCPWDAITLLPVESGDEPATAGAPGGETVEQV